MVAAVVLTAGCTAPNAARNDPAPAQNGRPDAVYVYDFTLDLSKVNVNAPGADLVSFKQKMRESAMRQLLEALNRAGIATYPFGRDLPPPTGNYWLVDPTFYNIDDKQNALSIYLYNQRGAHTSEVYVQISSLKTATPERIALFETGSHPSNEASLLLPVQRAVDDDCGRTAGMIANYIVNYFQKKGWLVELPPGASGPAQPSAGNQLLR
jgi:hypothetical protein